MPQKHHLASLQLAIMHILWEKGEATVAEVREALLPERPLAHTTVATMLTKMERKRHVKRRSEGRVNVYRPALDRERVSRSMLADLTQRLFQGNVADAVSQLLDGEELSREDIDHLKALIREKEKELSDGR
jgi:predicted transcriptional regulator